MTQMMWYHFCVKGTTAVFQSSRKLLFWNLEEWVMEEVIPDHSHNFLPTLRSHFFQLKYRERGRAQWRRFQWKSRHWAPVLYCPMKPLTPISAFSRWGQLLLVSFPILPCCVQVVSPNSPLPFSLIKPSKKRLYINGYFIKLSRNKQVHLSKQT